MYLMRLHWRGAALFAAGSAVASLAVPLLATLPALQSVAIGQWVLGAEMPLKLGISFGAATAVLYRRAAAARRREWYVVALGLAAAVALIDEVNAGLHMWLCSAPSVEWWSEPQVYWVLVAPVIQLGGLLAGYVAWTRWLGSAAEVDRSRGTAWAGLLVSMILAASLLAGHAAYYSLGLVPDGAAGGARAQALYHSAKVASLCVGAAVALLTSRLVIGRKSTWTTATSIAIWSVTALFVMHVSVFSLHIRMWSLATAVVAVTAASISAVLVARLVLSKRVSVCPGATQATNAGEP